MSCSATCDSCVSHSERPMNAKCSVECVALSGENQSYLIKCLMQDARKMAWRLVSKWHYGRVRIASHFCPVRGSVDVYVLVRSLHLYATFGEVSLGLKCLFKLVFSNQSFLVNFLGFLMIFQKILKIVIFKNLLTKFIQIIIYSLQVWIELIVP